MYPYPENNLLIIEIDVKLGIDISQEHFKEKLEEGMKEFFKNTISPFRNINVCLTFNLFQGLTTIYVEGMSQRRRRSSSQQSLSHTKDTGIFVKVSITFAPKNMFQF